MRRRIAIIALALVTILWTSVLVAAPLANAPRLSAAAYAAGSLVCHQRPDRSFALRDAQLAVCARCVGLYAGAIVGVFAWVALAGLRSTPTSRAKRLVASPRLRAALVVSALPTLATVATGALGVWDPGNSVRALLAVPLGGAIATLVAAVAADDLR